MSLRLRDLKPGDVVEHEGSSFRWRVLHVEPEARRLRWQPLWFRCELVTTEPPAVWSPAYTFEEWGRPLEGASLVPTRDAWSWGLPLKGKASGPKRGWLAKLLRKAAS